MTMDGWVACAVTGCDSRYPLDHEAVGEPGFRDGRWLGWLYLDINRPDLASAPLPFCGTWCLRWWLDNATAHASPFRRPVAAPLAADGAAFPDALAARRRRPHR